MKLTKRGSTPEYMLYEHFLPRVDCLSQYNNPLYDTLRIVRIHPEPIECKYPFPKQTPDILKPGFVA